MTTYRQIHGRSIQAVTTDPTGDVAEGQIWYNTTSDTFKTVVVTEAFSSAPNLPSIAFRRTGFGVQTAGVIAGGSSTSTNRLTVTEEYNGSGYSVGGTLTTGRRLSSGAGTQTAGLFYLGAGPSSDSDVSVLNETYDGTSYSEVGDLTTARQGAAGDGTQTSAFAAGGSDGSGNPSTAAETWDGSSWTNLPSINTSRRFLSGSGSPSAAVVFGGEVTPSGPSDTRKATEEYDGSSWTTVNSMNSGAGTHGSSGGSQTDVISFAGRRGATVDNAENYNGTTWSASPATLALARSMTSGLGSGTAALCATGETQPGPYTNVSEEYNKSANVITAAAWASGGALTAGARRGLASGKNSQTLTAGLVFGGGGNPYSGLGVKTEEYDGTSFTAGGDLNTYRYTLGGAGTQTAGLGFGGYIYPPAVSSNATEEYDGSSWTSVNNMSDARQSMASFGTQTAAIAAAGYSKPTTSNLNTTLSYDGTNWTALSSPANVNTTRSGLAGSGTQTAGLATGGNSSPYKQTEEWDGSAWTNQNSTIDEHKNVINQQLGIQTNALICSGGPPNTTSTEGYDGTTWSTRPNMASARYEAAAGGSATSGFVAGGFTSTNVTTTEEFTGETTAVNVKTLTQS